MAVSSGRRRIPAMEHPKEFFDIGRPFRYTPLSDKSVEMVLVPTECNDVVDDLVWNGDCCSKYCAVYGWCVSSENLDQISGRTFIPACSVSSRIDHANVYFKEL